MGKSQIGCEAIFAHAKPYPQDSAKRPEPGPFGPGRNGREVRGGKEEVCNGASGAYAPVTRALDEESIGVGC